MGRIKRHVTPQILARESMHKDSMKEGKTFTFFPSKPRFIASIQIK